MHGVTSFYWPRSFHVNYTFGKPRSFSAELTEDGGVSFLNHDGRLSLPERRGKTKTLCVKGMWIAVQLPPRKLVLHPLTHHLGFQARGFHTSTQVFSDATPKSSDLSTPTTRPTAVVLLDAPPQTKSATSRIGSFVFFFASICCGRSFDSSVMQESGDTYSWSDLCIPRIVRQVTSIEHQLMTNWICRFELSSFNINFPHVSIILSHLGSVFHVIQPGT